MKRTLAAFVLGTTLAASGCDVVGSDTDIVLDTKSITLAGPSCFAEVELSGIAPDEFRGWSVDDETVIGMTLVNPRSGTTTWRYRAALARSPGTARLVATDKKGGRAAVRVEVLDGRTAVTLGRDTVRVAVGDSVRVAMSHSGPCGRPGDHPFAEWGIANDTASVKTYSTAPAVATVRPTEYYFGKWFVGVSPGTTRVVSTFYGAADTAVVIVR